MVEVSQLMVTSQTRFVSAPRLLVYLGGVGTGLAIQWGVIGDVGIVHRHMGDDAMIAGFVPQNVKSCLETLDAFCQQDRPVVTSYVSAQQVKKLDGDLTTEVSKHLGVDVAAFDDPTKSLENIGLDSFAKVELKHLIDSYTDLNLTFDQIRNMSLTDIKALLNKIHNKSDETSPLFDSEHVKFPVVIVKHKEPLIVVRNDAPGDPIFIVNLGDTEVNNFQILAVNLKRPIYALVWTDNSPSRNIQSLASWYLKIIQEKVSGPFHLVGYSIGGSVAFEMAIQNQKVKGNLKTLTLISGSVDFMNALCKEDSEVTDPEVTAFCRFVEQFTTRSTEKLRSELMKEENQQREQRIQMVVRYLADSSHQTVDENELSEAVTFYLKKHALVSSYIPNEKLFMNINIIESSTKMLANDVTGAKELFGQVCSGNVSIRREFYSDPLTKNEDMEKIAHVLQEFINK